jgi:hypothetical protein
LEDRPLETAVHMIEENVGQLRTAVESQHGGCARLREVVAVSEEFRDQPVWQGIVHVFDLEGHPSATIAYAWSSPVKGTTRRRFYAVLGVPPINSALDAVRAAIVADWKTGGSA